MKMKKAFLLLFGALVLLNLVVADANVNHIASDQMPGPKTTMFRV
jgi:hypothetical protein